MTGGVARDQEIRFYEQVRFLYYLLPLLIRAVLVLKMTS